MRIVCQQTILMKYHALFVIFLKKRQNFNCRLLQIICGALWVNTFRNTIRVSNIWIQIRTDVLSVLIWIQTVCKGYQQKTKVAASKERVNVIRTANKRLHHMLHMCSFIHNYYFWQYTGIALDNKIHLNQKNYDISCIGTMVLTGCISVRSFPMSTHNICFGWKLRKL